MKVNIEFEDIQVVNLACQLEALDDFNATCTDEILHTLNTVMGEAILNPSGNKKEVLACWTSMVELIHLLTMHKEATGTTWTKFREASNGF